MAVMLGLQTVSGAGFHERPAAKTGLEQLAWLAGTWVTVNGDTTVEERWTPPEGGSMLGMSRTMKGGRMVAFEFLRITERDGQIAYLAQPGGRCPVTAFPLTQADTTAVTFENPTHDFPKAIRYSKRADGSIEARVSGTAGQPTESWIFKPGRP